ncbi:MAG: citrate/2-methylcitrate synthase [Ruminococcus sp.]|uniref:citrate/2-methylcitrate synthase n=1 Tax=Ruminococcus sp. TaxID=41978 RepID=UPI0025D49271|nr:citrate/2-methylcitrate synthase [Ruminococcus sp.]MBO4865103.1 citrate/2-methylcitrate synthase [Ruminococcus sp.]
MNSFKNTMYEAFTSNNVISPDYFDKYGVKRGLRNPDGTGVMAGVTNICNVHGYVVDDGEKKPADGKLIFRGYNIRDLVGRVEAEDRFGFEEIVYLLLTGRLPTVEELSDFSELLSDSRALPDDFFEDMILKAPSRDIMNKMARATLALYSYDSDPEAHTPEHEIDTAVSLIAKMPVIMICAYETKKRYYNNDSMFMHPLIKGQSTAENILSTLRPDRKFTREEAKLLDLMLMLHAEHGGGNNSTFSCRVLTSSGTDPYSAYAAAIGSLKGSKHGGANRKVNEMMGFIKRNVSDWEDENEIYDYLKKLIRKEDGDQSGLIYGMGHGVYTLSDPRAVMLKKYAGKMAEGTEFEREFRLLSSIENLTPQAFSEIKHSDKVMCANIDLYSGFVYRMLGIPEDLFTPMFAVSRMAGWCAHRFEEINSGRRIIRPAYKSVAPERPYIALGNR